MAHIFISYSRRDGDTLQEIALALEAAGHTVWWDVRSIQPGAHWQRAISTGIVDSDAVVLILSKYSVASEWVRRELEIARSKHKAILPVRIDGVEADYFPEFIPDESIQVLDAYSDRASGVARLISGLIGFSDHASRLPFTLAHPRLTEFVGRDKELREIHSILSTPKGSGRARVAVCGMGGIGKTQLCIEYVHRYRYFYPDGIVYLDAQANLNEQLARLAPALGLASYGEAGALAEHRDVFSADAVIRHLQELKGALLFLDNAPSVRALRQGHIGHSIPILALPLPILLNSRSRYEGPEVDRIDLGPLSVEESNVLLSQGRPELRDDPQTTELSRVLSGIPLALTLAAAFFSKKPKATPRSYLAELAEHGWEATLSLGNLKVGDIEAYPQASFVPALRAQWGLLDLESSQTFLAAAALHPPNTPIPIARLGILSGLSDSSDGMRTELSDAVREATTSSLAADGGPSRLILHAVVHDFIRRQAFADYAQQKERCRLNAMAALEDFAIVSSLFSDRGSNELVDDLLAMRGMFGDQVEFRSLCGDWLSVVHGHNHVFRALAPAALSSGFAQHVLLFSRVRMRERIEAMVKRVFVALGNPFFDVKWSSWLLPEQLQTRLLGERGATTYLAVTPCAQWAVNYTDVGVVQVWALPSGQLHSREDVGAVRSFAVSPGGDRLALLSEEGALQLLDLPSLRSSAGWLAGPVTLDTITFAHDDLLIGVAGKDGRLLGFELGSGSERVIEGAGVDSDILGIYRLRDDEIFLAMSDGQFAVHSVTDANFSIRGDFGSDRISVLAVQADGNDIFACTTAGLFRVDRFNGSARCINKSFGEWYSKADFFGHGRYVVSVAHRNTMSLLELANPGELRSLPSSTADDVIAGAREAPVFVAGNAHYSELFVWDLSNGIPRTGNKAHGKEMVNILTVGNGSRFVTTSVDWTAALWDRSTGDKVRSYGGGVDLYGYAKGLAKTVDDDRFVVGYTFRTCIYDVATGSELHSLQPPCDGVTAIAMAPSGAFFLTGSSDGWLLLWSEYCQIVGQWQIGDDEICSIAISARSNVIVGGTASGSVFVFVDSWRLRQWSAERGFVNSVCLSADGTLLYTAHHNGEVCLWNTGSGGLDCVLQGHLERVSHIALVADERILVTASHDGSIRFWCTRQRRQLEVLYLGQPVSCFDYCEGDATLLIGLAAGDVLAVTRVGQFVVAD